MSNRYGGSYRNGNGYGNFERPQAPQASQQPPQQQGGADYDPYGDAYSSSPANEGSGGMGGDRYVGSSSRGGSSGGSLDREQERDRYGPPPPRSVGGRPRPRQVNAYEEDEQADRFDPYDDRGPTSSRRRPQQQQLQPPQQQQAYLGTSQNQYQSGSVPGRRTGQDALDRIRAEWPTMCETKECVPVQMALQLLDTSSVGRAHEYRAFQRAHAQLQNSLKGIVHDYHQGFNSSIGTFHKIQGSIQASQKRVRALKDGLAASRSSLCRTDPELRKLYAASQAYDDLLQTLHDVEELRQVPERLEARISEKQFLTAVDVLQTALRMLRTKPALDDIGALADLRSYLANQETALMDILVEELHEHLYLKSPYCQERWQILAKHQGGAFGAASSEGLLGGGIGSGTRDGSGAGSGSGAGAGGGGAGTNGASATNGAANGSSSAVGFANASAATNFTPFFLLLDGMDVEHAVQEDPGRNPESDTFYYVSLVVESLNKLGRLEEAVDQLKQRLPVELFAVVNETVHEVDQKHPSSLRGGGAGQRAYASGNNNGSSSNSGGDGDVVATSAATSINTTTTLVAGASGLHIYGSRETQLRADVICDLLWTLFGKFEAIAEGHRIFHEYIKALIRREGAGNNSALLGSFKELWNLYQNEIRSLLHTYVTSDADLYRFGNGSFGNGQGGFSIGGGYGDHGNGTGSGREAIFRFAEADARSVEMASEYDALDGIIRAAVPGLTTGNAGGGGGGPTSTGKGKGTGDKKTSLISSRKSAAGSYYNAQDQGLALLQQSQQPQHHQQMGDIHKALVEPSVFNMSLLLPPTLVFLQRLKGIVPPGSDLATSTLTSFLDNFLVNVFQPQLDETLGKLSEAVFGEADAFQQDARWSQVARRPVFKGATAFFSVVTAFCRMLGTIPHDQALTSLIISQMMRYYDRCFSWFRALVTKTHTQEQEGGGGGDGTGSTAAGGGGGADKQQLRASAALVLEGGEVARTVQELWAVDEELAASPASASVAASSATAAGTSMRRAAQKKKRALLQKEAELLVAQTSGNERLGLSDVISDRDAIASLCLLYTSMKWLAVKIGGLRHITGQDTDASPSATVSASASKALGKPEKQRWTLLHEPSKALTDEGPVYLPMTQETVQSFDGIVSSYEELATTALMTLRLEARCRIAYALGVALSPEETAPYLLDQDVKEPDPQILALNGELITYDETVARNLRERETDFVRNGLGRLVNAYLVGNARTATPMNARGCGRMQLNILVLQQNLKNVEEGVDLARAANYYALFDQGPNAMVAKAKACKERAEARAAQAEGEADGEGDEEEDSSDVFTYDELKELLELYYSEPLANPERGIENAARRQLGEKLLELGEYLWQM